MGDQVRLQKFLADSGVASRRKCEQHILDGLIAVNEKVVTELGTKVDPDKDKVSYKGKVITQNKEYVYILLNKPLGYVTTAKDQFNRPIVMDLIKNMNKRLVPVGRLDMYTTGALILTNDGEIVNKITHPKHEITKTYTITLIGIITNEEVEQLRNGVKIDDYVTKPARVKILKTDEEKNRSRLEITIHEGKNRQIRRMCEIIGRKVLALHRSKIGNLSVSQMKPGEYRTLNKKEIDQLINNVR